MVNVAKILINLIHYKEPADSSYMELLEDEEGLYSSDKKHDSRKAAKQDSDQENNNKPQGLKKLPFLNRNQNKEEKQPSSSKFTISSNLRANHYTICNEFNMSRNSDTIIRELKIGRKINAFIVYIDGMINRDLLSEIVIPQLMNPAHFEKMGKECPLDYIINNVVSINQVKKEKQFEKIIKQILNGVSALFIDGCGECLLMETSGYEKRAVDKPVTETVVRGSQEGLNENMRTNITLIRRSMRNKKLITEIIQNGSSNNPDCAIMYMDGMANPKVIKEVKKRINNIKADFIGGTGMLEQFIEDSPYMLFQQVMNTERPDRAASFLAEGHVIILSEGTPFVSVVPVTVWTMIHTSEDSFLRWQYGTLIRLIRIVGILFATFLPALYVAVTLYHQEMIPSDLLLSIARSRENVPFPSILEVALMELSFELIREAGIRVPGVIGTTLGIIGALILGQAAVQAQLVSPVLIIVVAITGLGNFTIPNYAFASAIRILRFIFIALGGILGFYGIAGGIFIFGSLMCSTKSFGVPFVSPVAPKTNKGMDIIFRGPIWRQESRPDYLATPDRSKQPDTSRKWVSRKEDKN